MTEINALNCFCNKVANAVHWILNEFNNVFQQVRLQIMSKIRDNALLPLNFSKPEDLDLVPERLLREIHDFIAARCTNLNLEGGI